MILTQCPVCAAPLPDLTAKQCSRCKTRYCGPACQKKHWEDGGHDKLCRKIRKGGGAEQYNANTKYAEAVGAATMACAEDTRGQTCYICTEAVHRRTGEGLVRGCACHTTEGFVHISCLAEQAKILWEEAEANNLGEPVRSEKWNRWDKCSLCEQRYHGFVKCALGWACWKTYLGRPEADEPRGVAMNLLGNGLHDTKRYEDALSVKEAEFAMLRRVGASEERILVVQSNLALTYQQLGRLQDSSRMQRNVYPGRLKLNGEEHESTILAANNLAWTLLHQRRFEEAKSLMRKTMPVARRVLGECNENALKTRWNYAHALYKADGATLDDLREAVTTLEETERTARRVLGGAHPIAEGIESALQNARAALRVRDNGVSAIRDAVEAMTSTTTTG